MGTGQAPEVTMGNRDFPLSFSWRITSQLEVRRRSSFVWQRPSRPKSSASESVVFDDKAHFLRPLKRHGLLSFVWTADSSPQAPCTPHGHWRNICVRTESKSPIQSVFIRTC